MNDKHNWRVIVCMPDCSSVNVYDVTGCENCEDAARIVFAEHEWLAGWQLIAAVRGIGAVIALRDDSRTAEHGLL